jgi:predicted metalloprotease with PDZ domain
MKRVTLYAVVAVAVALLLAGGAVAGEKKHEKETCTASAEECLAKMKTKIASKPWLGIEYDQKDGRYVVTEVVDGSPADQVGFQEGDLLVAVNGAAYCKSEEGQEKLKAAWSELEPGSEAVWVVKRDGEKVKMKVTMGNVPPEIAKQWIDKHMQEYHPNS